MKQIKENWLVLVFCAMVIALFFVPKDKTVHVKYSIKIELKEDSTNVDSVTVKTIIDRSIESISTDLDSIYISQSND